MKVGDLVTYSFQSFRWRVGRSVDVGLIVEIGKYTGNADVKVLWKGKVGLQTDASQHLRLVDDALTSS